MLPPLLSKAPEPASSTGARPHRGESGPDTGEAVDGVAGKRWFWLGMVFFVLYAFATLVPRGDTWGLHALAYFPPALRILALLACVTLLWPPVQTRVVRILTATLEPALRSRNAGAWVPLGVAIVGLVAFLALPIRTTAYGDTRTILQFWADNTQLSTTWLAEMLWSHPLENRPVLTNVLYRGVAYVFAIPIEQAFRIVGAICGALWLGLWVQFVRSQHAHTAWGPLLLLTGCSLGAHQIFFGHVETYALVSLTSFVFLVAGYLTLQGKAPFWLTGVAYFVALKAHPVAIYYLPALLFLAASRLAAGMPVPQGAALRRALTWRGIALALIVPTVLAGVGLYLFYFQSYQARHTGVSGALPQTFLPVVPPPPPLDYSLLSMAHLVDLGNVLLLVCAPVAVVLLAVLLLHHGVVAWGHPQVQFTVLAFGFPLLFFTVVNPALSMPRDWDLFSLLAGPSLLLLATILERSREGAIPRAAAYGTALAFSIFSVGFWVLNNSPSKLTARLEDVGEYVFWTYHTNASFLLNSAYALDPDPDRVLARRVGAVERLTPAVVGEDQEYTHLLMGIATAWRERGDEDNALLWAKRATIAAPGDLNLQLWFADYLLWAGRPDQAQQTIEAILDRDPRNLNGLVLGAVAAAQREDYARALLFLERAGAVAPEDAEVAAWTEQVREKQVRMAKVPPTVP